MNDGLHMALPVEMPLPRECLTDHQQHDHAERNETMRESRNQAMRKSIVGLHGQAENTLTAGAQRAGSDSHAQ